MESWIKNSFGEGGGGGLKGHFMSRTNNLECRTLNIKNPRVQLNIEGIRRSILTDFIVRLFEIEI